jgi:hypothetical protein
MCSTDVSDESVGEELLHRSHLAVYLLMKANDQGNFAELMLKAYIPIARFKRGCPTSPARLDMSTNQIISHV